MLIINTCYTKKSCISIRRMDMRVSKFDKLNWLNFQFLKRNVFAKVQVARLNPEKSIPTAVLKGAKGLAILTVAKGGVVLAYKMGTGLVVARRSDGTWSAPSAILSVGLGWGPQVSSYFVL